METQTQIERWMKNAWNWDYPTFLQEIGKKGQDTEYWRSMFRLFQDVANSLSRFDRTLQTALSKE